MTVAAASSGHEARNPSSRCRTGNQCTRRQVRRRRRSHPRPKKGNQCIRLCIVPPCRSAEGGAAHYELVSSGSLDSWSRVPKRNDQNSSGEIRTQVWRIPPQALGLCVSPQSGGACHGASQTQASKQASKLACLLPRLSPRELFREFDRRDPPTHAGAVQHNAHTLRTPKHGSHYRYGRRCGRHSPC